MRRERLLFHREENPTKRIRFFKNNHDDDDTNSRSTTTTTTTCWRCQQKLFILRISPDDENDGGGGIFPSDASGSGVYRSSKFCGFEMKMRILLCGVIRSSSSGDFLFLPSSDGLPSHSSSSQRATVSVFGVQQPPSTRKGTSCLFSSDPNQDPFGSYFNAHPEAQQPQPQQSQSPPPPVQPQQQQPPPPGFQQQQQVPPSSNFGAPPPPPPVPSQPQQPPPVTTNNNNAFGAPPPLGQQPQPQTLNNNNPNNNINNDGFTTNRNNDVVYQSAIRPKVPVIPGTAGNAAGRYFQLEVSYAMCKVSFPTIQDSYLLSSCHNFLSIYCIRKMKTPNLPRRRFSCKTMAKSPWAKPTDRCTCTPRANGSKAIRIIMILS